MVLQIVYLNLIQIIQNLAETTNIQGQAIIINLLILDIRQVAPPDQITAHHPPAHLFQEVAHQSKIQALK